MKKILSLTLAVMLLVSAIPTAFAAETQDYTLGTAVTVEGAGGEYTVTVPATLSAGEVGTVTAKGYWSKDEMLTVTAPDTIEVTHTETNQKATVNVDFDGIESLGDDLEEMNVPVSISIDKGNTKFGTWTGTIVYNVELNEYKEPLTSLLLDVPYTNDEGYSYIFKADGNGRWITPDGTEMPIGENWITANPDIANHVMVYPEKATIADDWYSFTTEEGVVYTAQV